MATWDHHRNHNNHNNPYKCQTTTILTSAKPQQYLQVPIHNYPYKCKILNPWNSATMKASDFVEWLYKFISQGHEKIPVKASLQIIGF